MKIKKRKYAKITETLPIFTIPTFVYLLSKINEFIKPHLEWIWWIAITLCFILWFFINFKITKK